MYSRIDQANPYAIRAGASHNGYKQHLPQETTALNTFSKSVDMSSFFANNKSYEHRKIFLYNDKEKRSGSDYFKAGHNNRLVHHNNVPMKDKGKKYIHKQKENFSNPYRV